MDHTHSTDPPSTKKKGEEKECPPRRARRKGDLNKHQEKDAPAGSRTRVPRLGSEDDNRYTTSAEIAGR